VVSPTYAAREHALATWLTPKAAKQQRFSRKNQTIPLSALPVR
jgi:hypothetical protein